MHAEGMAKKGKWPRRTVFLLIQPTLSSSWASNITFSIFISTSVIILNYSPRVGKPLCTHVQCWNDRNNDEKNTCQLNLELKKEMWAQPVATQNSRDGGKNLMVSQFCYCSVQCEIKRKFCIDPLPNAFIYGTFLFFSLFFLFMA